MIRRSVFHFSCMQQFLAIFCHNFDMIIRDKVSVDGIFRLRPSDFQCVFRSLFEPKVRWGSRHFNPGDVDTITEDVAADLIDVMVASFRTFGRSVPSVRISAKTLLTILKSGIYKEFFCTSTNAIINGFLRR